MTTLFNCWESLTRRLRGVGEWVWPLGLRLILAWEFFEAGTRKLDGENWFGSIMEQFPAPFDAVPVDISWALATWTEVLGALALLFGLFTRFTALSLLVLTAVATAAVHWPDSWSSLAELWRGYAISDEGHGNFKLPLLFALMLLPLIFHGAGKLSLDHLLSRMSLGPDQVEKLTDGYAVGLGLLILASALMFLLPWMALVLAILALVAIGFRRFIQN